MLAVEPIHVDSTSRAHDQVQRQSDTSNRPVNSLAVHLIYVVIASTAAAHDRVPHAKWVASLRLFAWMSKWGMKMRQTNQSRPRPTSTITSMAVSLLPSHAACASAESGRENVFCSRRAEALPKVICAGAPWVVSQTPRVAVVRTNDHFTRIVFDIMSTSAIHQSICTLSLA
jgi:hypothetical protein